MRHIGGRWDNDTGWEFHSVTKNYIRKFLEGSLNEEAFENLKIESWWYMGPTKKNIEDGYTDPCNVTVYKKIIKNYISAVKSKKIKVPLKYTAYKQLLYFTLSLYVQDMIYYERFGGIMASIIRELQEEKYTNKEIVEHAYQWYLREEVRNYGKQWMSSAFERIINGYDTNIFYQQSIDFLLGEIKIHADKFEYSGHFNPERWFPRGRGQLVFMIEGRAN